MSAFSNAFYNFYLNGKQDPAQLILLIDIKSYVNILICDHMAANFTLHLIKIEYNKTFRILIEENSPQTEL